MKTAKRPPRTSSRAAKPPSFGDLCEISGGLAVAWRRNGCTMREMREFAGDEPFILSDVIPALHGLGFTEEDVLAHVPHDGPLARLALAAAWLLSAPGGSRPSTLAPPAWLLASFLRRSLTRRIAAMRNKEARPAHYEAEKARRRAMAEERRRMARRTTVNACPSRDELLEAWRRVRDSKESLLRFGSMMQDLECHVDNSLRFDGAGRIVGRNAGVKGWLRENAPEMAAHYTSIVRYKAAAKKLRQIVGLADPTPVAAVLGAGGGAPLEAGDAAKGISCNHGAEKYYTTRRKKIKNEHLASGSAKPMLSNDNEVSPVEVVRARAVYLEVMDGVPDVAAKVMARIDALCDPERTDVAATLRSWREKYENAITVRRKSSWWRRLTA